MGYMDVRRMRLSSCSFEHWGQYCRRSPQTLTTITWASVIQGSYGVDSRAIDPKSGNGRDELVHQYVSFSFSTLALLSP